jgi:hypothetical protein
MTVPSKRNKISSDQKRLIRRYLIWCYKTTKEELDRIDRKFTQLQVDYKVLNNLRKARLGKKALSAAYAQSIHEFERYITEKEKTALTEKYADAAKKLLRPRYWYLRHRLEAIKATVTKILGKKELGVIERLYEEEMTRRILESREST